jgi:putative PEP-CTERM system histidine kinase
MQGLIAFWSYALAACLFASILVWRLRARVEQSDRLLLGACLATVMWATVGAVAGPTDALTMTCGSVRNLAWIMLLYSMSSGLRGHSLSGLRLVFGAVALVIGLQLMLSLFVLSVPLPDSTIDDALATGRLLRVTMAAGALVLVHNIYGQAAPQSRVRIRGPMLGLTLMWGYDLNLYTIAYLGGPGANELFALRGAFVALISPLFAAGGAGASSLKVKLSRAATFQSLSLLGICIYLAVMAVLASAFRASEWNWSTASTAALLLAMTTAAAVLALSQWARGWVKVKLAKHLFEHRYDYRAEWLRFTDTIGRAGSDAAPLGQRTIQAFADIVDAPGGLLLVSDEGHALATAATWNWPAPNPPAERLHECAELWSAVESGGRVLDFEALRRGWASAKDRDLPLPAWLIDERNLWAGVPLIHHERLIGIVLLAAPEYRRPLDWEDFDLLRTAGRQAASSLAEARGQEALLNAQRFEEFNRRFAFILHDVKNLVSQLSLLTRNAERHADNPEFRTDMIATLKGSVAKMNELLARLSPHAQGRIQRIEAQALRPILTAAIAAKRGDHEVKLLGDSSLWALVDTGALEQAVGHLLQNAIDASPPGEPVTVRVASRPGAVLVSIADKGKGMDNDFVHKRLFRPFVSTKPGGFGIGSFEARSLIAAMAGEISVDSRPGHGTIFTIALPAAEAAAEPQRKHA